MAMPSEWVKEVVAKKFADIQDNHEIPDMHGIYINAILDYLDANYEEKK